MTNDYHVEFIAFPSGKVHEAVTVNEDDSITIFLDKNASCESQRERFLHVMEHLRNDDFSREDVQEIETTAHAKGEDSE